MRAGDRFTYRNNSELRMAAWHWNENGTWSDAAHQSGYFTGSTELKEPIRYILSYALPHRGFLNQRRPPAARAESQPTGKAIRISPASSREKATHCIRNG